MTDETHNSKHVETLSRFELEKKKQVSAELCLREKGPPPLLRSTCPMTLKLSMHILEVLTQLFTRTTLPRVSPGFRAINTQSDLGRTP